jgi:hypothetical protein
VVHWARLLLLLPGQTFVAAKQASTAGSCAIRVSVLRLLTCCWGTQSNDFTRTVDAIFFK